MQTAIAFPQAILQGKQQLRQVFNQKCFQSVLTLGIVIVIEYFPDSPILATETGRAANRS
jgi:hypothetical protein